MCIDRSFVVPGPIQLLSYVDLTGVRQQSVGWQMLTRACLDRVVFVNPIAPWVAAVSEDFSPSAPIHMKCPAKKGEPETFCEW
jgi:hypothetical protein